MKHLKEFTLFEQKSEGKKILFLHGLDSKPYEDRLHILKNSISPSPEVFAPHIDYKNDDFLKISQKIIEENGFNTESGVLIGHSYGGILAYYLSNKYKLPALMFNPAFRERNMTFMESLGDLRNHSVFKKQFAVVGMKDDVIIPEVQLKKLREIKATIWKVENLGHGIDPSTFETYYKKFMADVE